MAAQLSGEIQVILPPGQPDEEVAILRTRILTAVERYKANTGTVLHTEITSEARPSRLPALRNQRRASAQDEAVPNTPLPKDDELTLEERAMRYQAQPPSYDPALLVVPPEVRDAMEQPLDYIRHYAAVFEVMKLNRIQPFPKVALNFHGEPGTGKTHAAHALAAQLDKPILEVSYGDIESKYQSEGAKNVQALFHAAERDNAVLFIDDADSLLSKRFTSISQGSEGAHNALRTEMIVALNTFRGVIVFATNLIGSYDPALADRVHSVYFPKPDQPTRSAIWRRLLTFEGSPTLAPDVDFEALAEVDEVVGRDINNAIVLAAYQTARRGEPYIVTQDDLLQAIIQVQASQLQHKQKFDHPSPADPELEQRILKAEKKRRSKSHKA